MLKKLFKPFLFSGLVLLGLVILPGVSGHFIAKKQTAETDAIAQDFLKNYPTTTTNDAAKTLGVLTSGLGIGSITGTEADSITTDPAAAAALQAISAPLKDYLTTQNQKTQGPLDPIPENLQTYLEQNRETLTAIQSHLLTSNLPVWDFDVEPMGDFEFAVPSFMGLSQLQQLLSLKTISDSQQNQPAEMADALKANLVIQAALDQRPELISYLVSLIVTNQNMGVIRHLEGISPEISGQVLSIDQQQIGHERLSFYGWLTYQAMQKWIKTPSTHTEDDLGGLATFHQVPFYRTYLTLSNVNTAQITDRTYRQLPEFTVCSASVEDIEEQLDFAAPWWNIPGQIFIPSLVRQWQKGGQTMLAAELTHHVTTAKAIAAEQGQWPNTLPNLNSQTCPGEQWVYEVSLDGEMSLSFSHDLAWIAAETTETSHRWLLPLTYQASRETIDI